MDKDRLKKLYALAMRGVGGEKEQAEKILNKMLKKYGISIDDIDDDKVKEYGFRYHGKVQKKLLIQTIYKVIGNVDAMFEYTYTLSKRKCNTIIGARCTEAQKVEIEFLFDFYVRLWEKEQKSLLEAFIQKHDIFGKLKEGQKRTELSVEEHMKLIKMMDGLSDEEPLKQLTESKI